MRFKASGNSMRPWIQAGDLITLAPAEATRLKRGQVIAFETTAGMLTIHRLVALRAEAAGLVLVTRGDANMANDPAFGPDRVVGRVIEVRLAGYRVPVNSPVCWGLSALRRVVRLGVARK